MKSIDITKIQPTNWRFILGLILVVVVILVCIGVGSWIYGMIKGVGSKVTTRAGELEVI